jgi:putative phosphoesterase
MRVALISDLHGNEVALEAVLSDIARTGVDQLVCLGDTATLGPAPRQVLARLRDLGCVCILGNHDAFMLDAELIRSYSEVKVVVDAVDWCRSQLEAEDFAFIRSFVPQFELAMDDRTRLLLFHGTPRSHMEDLLSTTPMVDLDRMLAGHTAAVMACGHTHFQMLRQHKGMLIVNPGSVGMPFKQGVAPGAPHIMPYAEWACIEATPSGPSVSLKRVALDVEALAAPNRVSSNPIARDLLGEYAARRTFG